MSETTTNQTEAKINVDGKEYAVSALNDAARQHINAVRAADAELARLQRQARLIQDARIAHGNALKAELEKIPA